MSFPTPPPEDDPSASRDDNPFAPPPEGGSPAPVPPPPPPASPPPPAYNPPPPAYSSPAPGYGSPPPPPPPGYGSPPPAYGASAYGPGYGQPYGAMENGAGTTALVTGILGLFCCGLLSIVAIVMGRRGMALADSGRASNHGSAQAGMILGWIGVAIWVVGLLFVVIGVATGSSSSSIGAG